MNLTLEQRVARIERVLAEFIGQDARGSVWHRPFLWALRYWRRRALSKTDEGN